MSALEIISPSERSDLAYAAVVANTASSLFGWLQEQDVVRRLARQCEEDSLIDAFMSCVRVERTEAAVGQAYAILVALIIKRRGSGKIGEIPFAGGDLAWVERIWDLANARSAATSVESMDLTADPGVEHTSHGESGTLLYGPDDTPLV